jgi:HSP20 family protein
MEARMTVKGESLRELVHLQRRINMMFHEMLQPEEGHAAVPDFAWIPATDVSEDEGHYYADIELPGVAIENISVTCTAQRLKVTGERRPGKEISPSNAQRVERYFGPFAREISFPSPVESDKVKAELVNGLLSLAIPKKKNARKRVKVS